MLTFISIQNANINFGSFSLGSGTTLLVILSLGWYFIRHPEKLKKLIEVLAWLVSKLYGKAKYVAIKVGIENDVNSFIGEMEAKTKNVFPRISLKWATKGKDELIWEDGQVILVMKDKESRNKNFVHAAYFFVSEVLLRKSKQHLSKTQKTAIDLFATQKIIEVRSKYAAEQFMQDHFGPAFYDSDKVRGLVKQFVGIDKKGFFFPILINELSNLGGKIFIDKPSEAVVAEVKNFIDFLYAFSQREDGQIVVSDFVGQYLRCAIKIVASVYARGALDTHKTVVCAALRRGLENVYVVGSCNEENMDYMDSVTNAVLKEQVHVKLIRSDIVRGFIKIGEKAISVDTYLHHLHNPVAVKNIYEANDLGTLL